MTKKTPRLTEVFRRRLMTESKCTRCGTDGAYVGLYDVECPNPKCVKYKATTKVTGSPAGRWTLPKSAGGYPLVGRVDLKTLKKRSQKAYDSLDRLFRQDGGDISDAIDDDFFIMPDGWVYGADEAGGSIYNPTSDSWSHSEGPDDEYERDGRELAKKLGKDTFEDQDGTRISIMVDEGDDSSADQADPVD